MKRKIAVALAIFCALLLVSAVFAAFLLTRQISNTMRVLGAANMLVVRYDDLDVAVTSIAWGDFMPLDSKNSNDTLGTLICFKNVGNIGILVAWNATGLNRDNWEITATLGPAGTEPYPENDFNKFGIASGGVNGYVNFYLTSLNPSHPPEDSAFTLNFNVQQQP